MKTVSVVGSTGSIGTQTLDVVRASPGEFDVIALGAGRSVDLLAAQAEEFRPDVVAVGDASVAKKLADILPRGVEVLAGEDALAAIATEAQLVVNGVVGFAGLPVTLAALQSGRRLALANKESLIAGGPIVQNARRAEGAEILPVDSEHCAVHQCLRGNDIERVARLVITASGGPFRGRSRADLAAVTIDDALAHPTWSMGPKITVDSSTLMNKGLEVIEANELFGVGFDRIDVVVHPQSIVHSMVEFVDGATIAQLSQPDMRLPIAYALFYPDRATTPFGAIDWAALARLEFEPADLEAFPCLALGYAAGREGGDVPATLNAANEVAVAAFLDGVIPWLAIPDVIQEALDGHNGGTLVTAADVVEADRRGRELARHAVQRRAAA